MLKISKSWVHVKEKPKGWRGASFWRIITANIKSEKNFIRAYMTRLGHWAPMDKEWKLYSPSFKYIQRTKLEDQVLEVHYIKVGKDFVCGIIKRHRGDQKWVSEMGSSSFSFIHS